MILYVKRLFPYGYDLHVEMQLILYVYPLSHNLDEFIY